MLNLGLIGQAITASRSPSLHTLLGRLNQISVDYQLQEPKDDSAQAYNTKLAEIRSKGFVGVNVTYPYKQIAIDSADEVNDAVKKVGATNTLLLKDDKVCAFNTDYTGFIRGFKGRVGDLQAGKVLIIGAGGVGRAIGFALFEVGATEVFVTDLNEKSALSLVNAINDAGYKARYVAKDDIPAAAKEVDGLVNCTPVGHFKSLGMPISAELIENQKWAFDAVYTPMDTEFLVAANKKGLKIVSGFDLFFYQGIDAFEIFTGEKILDEKPVFDLFCTKYDVKSDLI
ncbi:shikimate dehydrogenase [Marinomonas mediterranea]|uniref:shikimate dehydrogenase (NADP(+)) n=1 Tax=Marinomonas mediterranea (strain ATCC 700492 / JCM 21426 / NBRC 103028 / MMB-1) TaxID=717774 RepID=F2JX85_MARM1|nr:shikimate dehydrogenase [Marinomonas mediterranea]ADZ90691.1 Shikimate dehydrogenase substrate binding domain protein [Marinomonas mediterranea MMB-1]WCN12784.1 shikimate dehydrogenase [Marinomonas mediterranea]WCN16855.1 shikimate dehydrogenase [Marinomonas mediterranea MMB-1]